MSFEVDNSRIFKRAYAHNLDRNKNWYAYNKSLLGYQESRNPEEARHSGVFRPRLKGSNLSSCETMKAGKCLGGIFTWDERI